MSVPLLVVSSCPFFGSNPGLGLVEVYGSRAFSLSGMLVLRFDN